jgi:hypothetical protein
MASCHREGRDEDGAPLLVIAECALSEVQVITAACIIVVGVLGLFIIIVHHNFEAAKKILRSK